MPIAQPKNDKGEDVPAKANPYSAEEMERIQQLVRGVVGYNEERKDVLSVVQARFETEVPLDLSLPWHKNESVTTHIKSGLLGLVFVIFLLLVVRPLVMHLMRRDKEAAQAAAASIQAAQREAAIVLAIANGESEPLSPDLSPAETLEEMKAKLKPKKPNISAEMMDTANTYDDKVALIRMIVSDDSARVANVLKSMIKTA